MWMIIGHIIYFPCKYDYDFISLYETKPIITIIISNIIHWYSYQN